MPEPSFDLAEVAETLRASEQRYRELFERAPAPMFVIDAHSLRILGVNGAAMSRYGYARDELLELTLRDLWPPFERGSLFRAQVALRAGHDVRGVFRHWSRDHELFDVELLTRSLPSGDERLRMVLAFDVSEHTRAADVSSYLDRATALVAGSLEVSTLCRNLAAVAVARLGDWCAVYCLSPEGAVGLEGFAHANPLDEALLESAVRARHPLPAEHPVMAVFHGGRSRVLAPGNHSCAVMRGCQDAAACATGDADARLTVRAAMYLAIHARGRVLAVLECVASSDSRAAAANNLALGEELASRAAIGLDGALTLAEVTIRATPAMSLRAAPGAPAGPTPGFPLQDASTEVLLEHITDGFIALDTSWRVTYANGMAERIMKRPRGDLIGRSFWDAFPEVTGTAFDREYRRAAAQQEAVEFEAHYPARDVWYRVRVHPSPEGLAIFFHDTTLTHRAEADRRESNRTLYEYADMATDLIHLLAPDGRVVYANRAWRETLGYEEHEMESMRIQDIVAPEFRQMALDSVARWLAGDTAGVLELDVLAKDGRRIRVAGGGTFRFVNGRPVAALGIFRDVTAQRESEAAVQAARLATVIANRTRTAFLDRVNHELRTPLTGIIGFAALLERNRGGGMTSSELNFAARISRQGRELLGVIEDVLAYAEIEGNRLQLDVAPVDLRGLVDGVVADFAERAAAAGTSIVLTMPPDLAPIETDATRVRQIVRHLLDNAIKFSEGGDVSIAVVTHDDGRRPLRLEVRDRGIGIPEGLEAAMLEPFEQATPDNSRKFGGLGLGLTIARSLARVLGFELSLRAREGEGTSAILAFTRTVPTRRSAGATGRTSGEHEAPERESTELATLLHGVVSASPLAVIAYDSEYVVRLWNDAATRLLGWSATEAVGTRVPFVPPSEQAQFRELLRRVVTTGGVTEEPVKRQRKDGSVIEAHASIAPLRDTDGRLLGFVSLIADVTEQNRKEEQLRQAQKMDILGQLAGGIAHDFNNLLTVMGANASFLMQDLDAHDPRRRDAEEIGAACRRAAALTRQLLLFARKQVPEQRLVDLRDIVTDARRMLERLIGSNIELATLNAPDECLLVADPGQLEQLVMNLVLNARDAMPQGGALVVETGHTTIASGPGAHDVRRDVRGHPIAPGDYVVLAVSDVGVGMEPATIERIFEPFYTTKAPGEGTGLGLSTVDTIVTGVGGFILVESSIGAGTTFRIHLRAAPDDASAREARERRPATGGSETILLVEDQEAVRTIASRILRAQGYTVLTARHGMDALELVARYEGPAIRLLLTDIMMPEMSGYSLAAQLRELLPAVRVVLMSGYSESAARHSGDANTLPTAALVQKPFTAETLVSAVRRALDAPN